MKGKETFLQLTLWMVSIYLDITMNDCNEFKAACVSVKCNRSTSHGYITVHAHTILEF